MNLQPPDPPEDTRAIGDVLDDVLAENAELRRKLDEQESIFNAVLNPRGNDLDGFAAMLSKAKQAGRDEVMRELSEQEADAWCAVKPESMGTWKYEFYEVKPNPIGIRDCYPLIRRPSAPIADTKGRNMSEPTMS